jgi:CHAT domain-containing protein
MLVRSMPGGRFAPAEARFVLHDRPTAMELASSLVADTTGQAHDWTTFDPQMAAYGVSNFDTLRTVPPSLRTAHPGAAPGSTMTLPSLPGVRDELRALQSTVPRARVRLDGQATERRLRRSIRNAGVLHVASHAFVNDASPLQNAILLRPDSREGGTPARPGAGSSDGVLFLHELQGQRAQIPMVVLSGCSTGAGTLRGGEGMEGLQYAFRAMGAQSTVSTLWPVADRASVDLMRSFYHNLQDGDPKDVALREAQLAYLEDHPKKASPFFWAPPVLYGSPASLPLDGPPLAPWVWWGLGVIVVVGIGGGGWVLHRSSADPPVA